MFCKQCQHPCDEQDLYCANCGTPLAAPEKKGRHWVPLLMMAVLALCCTALFFAVPMQTREPVFSEDMPWFSIENSVLYFDESKYTGITQLTVPEKINNISVVAIGDSCFMDCSELTEIYLPDTLEAIGEEAFLGCSSLRGIEIPESVAFIGKDAFANCSALEAVCLSNKLQHIGDGAFDGCDRLQYVYFLGSFREWTGLYQGFIAPTVVISCDDGRFFQNGNPA